MGRLERGREERSNLDKRDQQKGCQNQPPNISLPRRHTEDYYFPHTHAHTEGERHSAWLQIVPQVRQKSFFFLSVGFSTPCLHAHRSISSPVPHVTTAAAGAAAASSSAAARDACCDFRSPAGSIVPISFCEHWNRRRARPSEKHSKSAHQELDLGTRRFLRAPHPLRVCRKKEKTRFLPELNMYFLSVLFVDSLHFVPCGYQEGYMGHGDLESWYGGRK